MLEHFFRRKAIVVGTYLYMGLILSFCTYNIAQRTVFGKTHCCTISTAQNNAKERNLPFQVS